MLRILSLLLVPLSLNKAFYLNLKQKIVSKILLNRIFFEQNEFVLDEENRIILNINNDDLRFKHITNILKLNMGDILKIGILDMGSDDQTVVTHISDDVIILQGCTAENLLLDEKPIVDLILAVPRPLRLERLLPVITSQGIGKLVLIGAEKVEKDYFGSHLFRRPEALKECLVEGLSQAGIDCHLPEVLVRKQFHKFIKNDLNILFDPKSYTRVICHPLKDDDFDSSSIKFSTLRNHTNSSRIVVAIGPEGGWTDEEVLVFKEAGFQNIDLGRRILRTDTAVVSALSLAHKWAAIHIPSIEQS